MTGHLTEHEQPTEDGQTQSEREKGQEIENEEDREANEEEEQPRPKKKSFMSLRASDVQRDAPTMTSDDPAAWWWNNRSTYPVLSELAFSYLCAQASSAPRENIFSTAEDTVCAERSQIISDKANMLIFLDKNC